MAKPKHLIYCPKCGRSKMLFETQKKADLFIKFNSDDVEQESKSHKKPVRSYYCDVCCGWHVTSIPKWRGEKDAEMTDNIILNYYIDTDRKKKFNDYYNKRFGKSKQ